MRTIAVPALRRLVVAAQGYVPRARRAGAEEVESAIRRGSCIQLDSIPTVERSHRVAIASRTGVYPPGVVPKLLHEGRVIEYWAHALCLLPAEDWPLLAWVRERLRDNDPWHGDVKARYPGLAERVLGEIRERGALGSRDFSGKKDPLPHRDGTMWSWKPAKQMLDALFAAGELVIAGRDNGFQRLYDLPERVLPRDILDAPMPSAQESIRALIANAVRARGALTEYAIAEHWRPIWWLSSSRRASSSTARGPPPPSSSRRSTTCFGRLVSGNACSASST